jgi:hypothetical protein
MDVKAGWEIFDAGEVAARRAHARRLEGLAGLLDHYHPGALAHEVAERCQVSYSTARSWVGEAQELSCLPHLSQAFSKGCLSTDQLSALRVLATPETEAGWVKAVWEDLKGELGIDQLNREARRQRCLELTERDGGRFLRARSSADEAYTDVRARLYPEEGAALLRKLDSLVPRGTHPDRFESAHADALMALVNGRSNGVRATVLVAAQADTIRGEDDQPGVLLGTGHPLPAGVVRELAGRGRVVEVSGPGVGTCTSDEDVPEHTRRLVWVRDRGACRFPGCDSPPDRLQIHHLRGRRIADPHHPSNLALLCRFDHLRVHRDGWAILGDGGGSLTWLRPDGTVYDPPPRMLARPPNAT